MYSKTLILLGVFAIAALTVAKPVEEIFVETEKPPVLHVIEVKNEMEPPPLFVTMDTFCLVTDSKEECKARHDNQAKENDARELADLNEWISGLDKDGKNEWRTKFPGTATRYDQLKASA
ncbi:unnamed protein product [Orchesella dallaii]|uniref:Uncharacterized protein n=1 Tax=Orchesella dallaii TaxID=48710 RepID=A0ABP1RPZ2_9HEXA